MWDESTSLSNFKKSPADLTCAKAPFSDLAMTKCLQDDTSPFSSIFTDEMLRESNLSAMAGEEDEEEAEEEEAIVNPVEDDEDSVALIGEVPSLIRCSGENGLPGCSQPYRSTTTNCAVHFICENCGYATVHRKNFMAHKRTHAGVKSFSCELCSAKFTRSYSLKKHLAQKHSHPSTSLPKYCPFPSCNYVTRNANALQVHRRARHTSLYYCKLCHVKYSLRRSLLQHLTLHHDSNVDFFGVKALQEDAQDECKVDTGSRANDASKGQITNATNYQCDKCDFSAMTLRGVYHHKRFKHPGAKRVKKPASSKKASKNRALCKNEIDSAVIEVNDNSSLYPSNDEDSNVALVRATLPSGSQIMYNPLVASDSVDKLPVLSRANGESYRRVNGFPVPLEHLYSSDDPTPTASTSAAVSSNNVDNKLTAFDEVTALNDYVRCVQESNGIMYDLYKRKTEELDNLRRLCYELVARVLPKHSAVKSLHSWRNVDSVIEQILNSNET